MDCAVELGLISKKLKSIIESGKLTEIETARLRNAIDNVVPAGLSLMDLNPSKTSVTSAAKTQ